MYMNTLINESDNEHEKPVNNDNDIVIMYINTLNNDSDNEHEHSQQ